MRNRPPKNRSGFTIEEVQDGDLDEIASRLNGFYKEYNLYEPQTAETLKTWLKNPLLTNPFCHYYTVKDKNNNILAGMGAVEEYLVRTFVVFEIPFTTKLINAVLNFVPKNMVIRQIIGTKVWFEAEQAEAANFLFDTLRYQWREKADAFICHLDPRSNLTTVLDLPNWRPKVEYFTMTLEPMNDQLICPII